jgi:hypothetical protein
MMKMKKGEGQKVFVMRKAAHWSFLAVKKVWAAWTQG